MLHVAKDTFWRFVEHRISPSIGLPSLSRLKNYRTEARILDTFGPHAMKKRALRAGRKKKEEKSNTDPRRTSFRHFSTEIKVHIPELRLVYHGDRARYHYFQCLQLVLRYQIKALIELWKLPPEFEVRSPLLGPRHVGSCSL